MNEFELIANYFQTISTSRTDVIIGSGDDAACLALPSGTDLLVSTDTLLAGRHFLTSWDAYDIAYRAMMVNISDIAAMGGEPAWVTLALTIPDVDPQWLARFSQGLQDALKAYNIALVGGDLTNGPMSITPTVHGLVPSGQAVKRSGAKAGDKIMVTGNLGAAALAVDYIKRHSSEISCPKPLMDKLLHPTPRVDLNDLLRTYASAAIDISDGLSSDLNHICKQSGVGAMLQLEKIPIHPLVKELAGEQALEFALHGGDDYELCITFPAQYEQMIVELLSTNELRGYVIGEIVIGHGVYAQTLEGRCEPLLAKGYRHF